MSKYPLFKLGRTTITRGALSVFQSLNMDPIDYLEKHQTGDYGDLGEEDIQANVAAIQNNNRIFSAYQLNEEYRIYVITEHDRSLTTILLNDEY